MGSPSNKYAYIAGFLDGDGSIMLQLKKRSDSTRGVRFMTTICFYQDSRHSKDLVWIRKVLKCGYFSQRNDGMSELRIQGFASCEKILLLLKPFIRFKQQQANLVVSACSILNKKTMRTLTNTDKKKIVKIMLFLQEHNYATRSAKSEENLYQLLGVTP